MAHGCSKADVRKKQAATASIDAHRADLISLADQVWALAETALREMRSAALLADTAHAAFDPWNGGSAVDALELFTHGVNTMREHVKPTVRMHYAILEGGDVPNVVPDHAKLWIWARDFERKGVDWPTPLGSPFRAPRGLAGARGRPEARRAR